MGMICFDFLSLFNALVWDSCVVAVGAPSHWELHLERFAAEEDEVEAADDGDDDDDDDDDDAAADDVAARKKQANADNSTQQLQKQPKQGEASARKIK